MADCSELSLILHDMAMVVADNNPRASFETAFREVNVALNEAGVGEVSRGDLAMAIHDVVEFNKRDTIARVVKSVERITRQADMRARAKLTREEWSNFKEIQHLYRTGQLYDHTPKTSKVITVAIQNLRKAAARSKRITLAKIKEAELQQVRDENYVGVMQELAGTEPKSPKEVEHGLKALTKRIEGYKREISFQERIAEMAIELESPELSYKPARQAKLKGNIKALNKEYKGMQREKSYRVRLQNALKIVEAYEQGKKPPAVFKAKEPDSKRVEHSKTLLEAAREDIKTFRNIGKLDKDLVKLQDEISAIVRGEEVKGKPKKKKRRKSPEEQALIKKKKDLEFTRRNLLKTRTEEQLLADLTEQLETGNLKSDKKKKLEIIKTRFSDDIADKRAQVRATKELDSLRELLDANKVQARQSKRKKEISEERQRLQFMLNRARNQMDERVAREAPLTLGQYMAEPFNIARNMLSSGDFSASLRQGGLLVAGDPRRFPKPFWESVRSFASKDYAEMKMEEIFNDPLFVYSQSLGDYKLSMTEMNTTKGEEHMRSVVAEKLPIVAQSNRAFTVFMNSLRMNTFGTMVGLVNRRGNLTSDEAQAVAYYINLASGRTKGLHATDPVARRLIWSPQLTASRIQYAFGMPLWKALLKGKDWRHPIASDRTAKQATNIIAAEYARQIALVGVVIAFGQMMGGEVEDDPRNSDWGKIKFGDTRFDMMTGIQQVYVLEERLRRGSMISPVSGKETIIRGEGKDWGVDSLELGTRWMRNKAAPGLGTLLNFIVGSDPIGRRVDYTEPKDYARELLFNNMPMTIQDVIDAAQVEGIPFAASAALPASLLGIGVQTFEDKPRKTKRKPFKPTRERAARQREGRAKRERSGRRLERTR
jgi:hypothetical protein